MKGLSRLLPNLAKFWRLNVPEKRLLIRVFVVLAVCKVLLLIIPFRRFVNFTKTTPQEALKDAFINKRVWAVRAVSAQVPFGFTCLVQAISTKWLLRNHPDVRVHIGVRKDRVEGFSAHAWLTYKNSIILGEQSNHAFEPILTWD